MISRLALVVTAVATLAGCALHRPAKHQLVAVRSIRPAPIEEIRYATRYNFTGTALYPVAKAFVHRDAAIALERVQRDLAVDGLGLKIYDGYRPLSVQKRMWDLIGDERYVSNPAVNLGRHTRGTAVDVTLVDRLGNPLEMPSNYDDFSAKAHRNYAAMSSRQRENLRKLDAAMKKNGFVPYPYEWWHFDLARWDVYPALDVSLDILAADSAARLSIPYRPISP